jgi:hypothetical protein
MWKSLGVFTVWIAMIAAPHLRPAVQVGATELPPQPNLAPAPAATPAPSDDPGDPFLRQKKAEPGSVVTIHFKNLMGKTVSLTEVLFTLDQQALPTLEAPAPDRDAVIYSGRLSPGMHLMKTEIHLQGNARGPITYTKGYHFTVTAEQVLTVPANRAVVFTIMGTRNKGMNVSFDKQYDIQMTSQESPPITSSLSN